MSAGEWKKPVTLSEADDDASSPRINIDSQGNIIVLWNSSKHSIQTLVKPYNGVWGQPEALEKEHLYRRSRGRFENERCTLKLSAGPSKNVAAVWWKDYQLVSAFYSPEKSWNLIDLYSYRAQSSDFNIPQIEMDNEGNAIVVTTSKIGSVTKVFAVEYSIDALSRNPPIQISSSDENAQGVQLAIDGTGKAIVTWYNPTTQTIRSVVKPFKDNWGSPVDLYKVGSLVCYPELAVNGQGDVLISWSELKDGKVTVQMESYP